MKSIHTHIIIDISTTLSDLISEELMCNNLCFGALGDYAHKLFDEITHPTAFPWTSLINSWMIEAIDQVLSYQKLLSRRHQGTCETRPRRCLVISS
ncbi:hypothetical protein RGQ29_023426 [Quercus rubra]|uniref:Uncharacterized protein n=1 Tax=Quercus rubra TaxID=3512 RepID=A0AAN7F5I9_QUERU|nr:hypothetical protein RGQ29_023426 [Quercus rubra]